MTNKIATTNITKAVARKGGNSILSPELFARWIAFIDVKPASAKSYLKAVRRFARWCSDNHITQPQRDDIIAFRTQLLETVKATSAQLLLTAVKLFFRFLDLHGLYPNVADHVKGVKLTSDHKRDALTAAQARKVLTNIDTSTLVGKRNRAIIALMLATGLRSIEVERANVEDIHMWHGKMFLAVQGKGRDDRAEKVALPDDLVRWINEYLEARGNRDGALFQSISPRNRGERLHTQSLSKLTKAAFRAVGLDSPRLTCHSCRHTFATTALINGVDLANVSMALRHKSINTTSTYRHDLDRRNNPAEEVVAASILGGIA